MPKLLNLYIRLVKLLLQFSLFVTPLSSDHRFASVLSDTHSSLKLFLNGSDCLAPAPGGDFLLVQLVNFRSRSTVSKWCKRDDQTITQIIPLTP